MWRKPHLLLLFLLGLWFLPGGSLARAAGITATVDRTQVNVGDRLVLTITVEGSMRARPTLPDLSPFQVYSGGQSTQVQIVNMKRSLSAVYTYYLLPRREGTFTIGPATVELKGRTQRSDPIRITVLPPEQQPNSGRDLFITATVSETDPYVSQQVVYTFRFYRRVQVADASLQLPSMDDFVVQDLGEQRDYEKTLNGQKYLVTEIKKALFPQEAGEVTIAAASLNCQVAERRQRSRSLFDDFFSGYQTRSELLHAPAIDMRIKPLPPAPSGFSGLVGSFKLKASLSRNLLHVGESATLTATITGSGNVHSIPSPLFPELEGFKVYDDKPTAQLDTSGSRLRASREFKKALIPLKAGQYTIPATRLIYFDPQARIYRTASSGSFDMNVLPSENGEELNLTEGLGPSTGKVAVKVVGDDILPIYRRVDAIPRVRGTRAQALFAISMSLPPAAWFALLLIRRHRYRYSANSQLRRRREAFQNSRKAMRGARALVAEGRNKDAALVATRALKAYIGDKTGTEGSALTPAEVAAVLARKAISESLCHEVESTLQQLEAMHYGVVADEKALSSVPRMVGELLKRLNKEFSRRAQ